MFCPDCKTEYRAGFSRCSDCGASLVERLDTPASTNRPQDTNGPELLWTGTDIPISSAITAALDKKGIPYHTQTREVGLLPGLSQPFYAVFIPARHHDAAQAAMEEARREFENGHQQPDERSADSESSLTAPSGPRHKIDSSSEVVPENYDPDEATAEVWSGNDSDTKDMLIACLRENGIGCELDTENSLRIRVMPSSEPRAREIIREVIEGSPPL